MLCPRIHRQRLSVEFLTSRNLYEKKAVETLLENFLHDLCGSLRMTPLMGPFIGHAHDGTSAYMGWMDSGVHVHSWFGDQLVTVDVYSCKPYMVSDVLNCIDFWFEPKELDII